MGMQTWVQLLDTPAPTASGTALASSTTLTDITPSPALILPANFLYPGSVLRVVTWGEFSSISAATLLLGVYFGGVAGTALATSGALASSSGATPPPITRASWRLTLEAEVRTIGTTGTIFSMGVLNGVGTSPALLPATSPAAVTVNTTLTNALTIGAQWGTNSASNTVTLHGFFVESLN